MFEGLPAMSFDGVGIVLWNSCIYSCSSMNVLVESNANSFGSYLFTTSEEKIFSVKNAYYLSNNKFDYETYKVLFESYFPTTVSIVKDASLRYIFLDAHTDMLFGIRLKDSTTLLYDLPYDLQWGFAHGDLAVRTSNFITGSAVGDFNEILDPKLLK